MKHLSYGTSTLCLLAVCFVGYEAWEMLVVAMPVFLFMVGVLVFGSLAVFVPCLLFVKLHSLWFVEHAPVKRVASPRKKD